MKHEESDSQIAIFQWAELSKGKYPELAFLCGSLVGVRLNIVQAVRAKRMGVKKGYPDIFLPVAREKYFGLFIELKSKDGRVKPEQKIWHKFLSEQGYLVYTLRSAEEAIKIIQIYLSFTSLADRCLVK